MKIRKIALLLALILISFNMFSCATKKIETQNTKKLSQYYFKLGVSYLNSGNIAEAIYNLNKAYSLNPRNPDILNALGIAYTKVGEFDKAQEYFLRAIKIAPEKPESYVNLGILLAEKKDYGSALKYLMKAAKNPNYRTKEKAYYNMALIYLQLGNLRAYENALKKAIVYNSFFLPAYEELGRYYMKQEKYDEARKIYERAISLGLGSPEIYYNLGVIFYKKRNLKLSRHYLNKALITAEERPALKEKIQNLIDKIYEEVENKQQKHKNHIERKSKKIITFPKVSKKPSPEPLPEKAPIIPEKNFKPSPPKIIVKKTKPKKKKKSVIRFFINLGIFSSKKSAEKIKRKLELYRYNPKIEKIKIDGTIYYRVYIGYFDSYLKASRFYKKNIKPLGFKGLIKFKRVEYEPEKG